MLSDLKRCHTVNPLKIKNKNIPAGSVTWRDLIPALKGFNPLMSNDL
jgi:hypothetical protein